MTTQNSKTEKQIRILLLQLNKLVLVGLCFAGDRLLKIGSLQNTSGLISPHINKEGIFGLAINNSFIVFLSLVLVGLLAVVLFFIKDKTGIFSLALILGGGIGNLFDRVWYGGVIDPFVIYSLSYNVADIMIVLGAGLIFWKKLRMAKLASFL